ncbi:MAG: hypothetical protein AB1916_07425 [Thermodesulfobacteriota bacterium]
MNLRETAELAKCGMAAAGALLLAAAWFALLDLRDWRRRRRRNRRGS